MNIATNSEGTVISGTAWNTRDPGFCRTSRLSLECRVSGGMVSILLRNYRRDTLAAAAFRMFAEEDRDGDEKEWEDIVSSAVSSEDCSKTWELSPIMWCRRTMMIGRCAFSC